MASGDTPNYPKNMTYSKSTVPIIGALIDYFDTSIQYLVWKTFAQAEQLSSKPGRTTLSANFLALVCLALGFTANVKFEVAMLNEEPLPDDLHFMLLSKDDVLYIDDIDTSRVMWCMEASDMLVLIISCLMILSSPYVCSPQSEYLFLPWLGVTLRGLLLRQAPTAGAFIYTVIVVNGAISPLFLTTFLFLFLLEIRLWLEIARVVRLRWDRRNYVCVGQNSPYELETLWSNEDVQSVEVQNYIY